jgi:hypothetical protein
MKKKKFITREEKFRELAGWNFRKLLEFLFYEKKTCDFSFSPDGYIKIEFEQNGIRMIIKLYYDQTWGMEWW